MEKRPFTEMTRIWREISFRKKIPFVGSDQIPVHIDMEFLHAGDYYYFLFNLTTHSFDYLSDNIVEVLGYEKEDITVPFFISIIHPDDLPYFMLFEKKAAEFFNDLSTEQLTKYKIRYDYRLKTKNGQYIRVLHQMITLSPDEGGEIAQTLGYHTDITYLKESGKPLLSFIGLDGEPSYVDVSGDIVFQDTFVFVLSNREKEIVKLLAKGLTSNEIAKLLNISPHTVRTHRKNILTKMELNSTIELTAKVIKEGWL